MSEIALLLPTDGTARNGENSYKEKYFSESTNRGWSRREVCKILRDESFFPFVNTKGNSIKRASGGSDLRHGE